MDPTLGGSRGLEQELPCKEQLDTPSCCLNIPAMLQSKCLSQEVDAPHSFSSCPAGRKVAHTDQGARNQSLLVYPLVFSSLNACV